MHRNSSARGLRVPIWNFREKLSCLRTWPR